MTIELDIPKTMVDRVEAYLLRRAIEIDGHPERATEGDQCASLIFTAGRKKINAEKRARKDKA